MDASDIDTLLHMGERISFECKAAQHEIPGSVWETLSAFANTIGGVILLGVREDPQTHRYEPIGIPQERIADFKKQLFDTLNNPKKINRNILTDSNVEAVNYEDKWLLAITVPKADYRQRPIYINGNLLSGTFKRNHEGDYHCSEEEVKTLIRDANESGNDGLLIENYGMDDIDPPTLAAYRQRFISQNPDHILNQVDDKEFLTHMGGYTYDRNTGEEGLTLAGLMMFGTGLAVSNRFDNIRMDYLDLTNLAPGSRWSDRITYDGRWENNLYNFFMRVLPKLLAQIKQPFSLPGTVRVDDSPVHKLIREALTNMIIHADYMISGVLKVEKHDDRLLFSNPGSLKLPVYDIYRGGNSVARNPKIQTMLRMIGLGDNIGSGFPTILDACKSENWRQPVLVENQDLHLVELTVSMVSLIDPESERLLAHIYGADYRTLSTEEKFVLSAALAENGVSNYDMQLQLDKNPLEAGKLLYAMVKKNLLITDSKGRWTTYTINNDYRPSARSFSQGGKSKNSRGTDPKTQGVQTQNSRGTDPKTQGVQTQNSRGIDQKLKGYPPPRDAAWKKLIAQHLDTEEWGRHRWKTLLHILDFCCTPKTLTEIAEEVGLKDKYRMKRVYIDPLLDIVIRKSPPREHGDLAMTYSTITEDPT